ncbi:MAG: DUF2281 domain-containing protein [Candidatus Methanofastidiosia archaeon]|jgi:hypothetical protein
MNKRELLLNEIKQVPEPFLDELLDFVQFLKIKKINQLDTAIAAESSLKKDWLRQEEDEAWRDL